jgi:hypothetical protein
LKRALPAALLLVGAVREQHAAPYPSQLIRTVSASH